LGHKYVYYIFTISTLYVKRIYNNTYSSIYFKVSKVEETARMVDVEASFEDR